MENKRVGHRLRRDRNTVAMGSSLVGGPALRNYLAPVEPLTSEQLMYIHESSLTLLEEIGIEFMGSSARALFSTSGADVTESTGLVHIPREMVQAALRTAPSTITITPRNKARQLIVGQDYISFGLVAGPPNVHDCVNGRRPGNYADYVSIIKLAQSFDIIHFIGNQPISPIELPAETRHLDCYRANLIYSDRVYHCTAIGRARALDAHQ